MSKYRILIKFVRSRDFGDHFQIQLDQENKVPADVLHLFQRFQMTLPQAHIAYIFFDYEIVPADQSARFLFLLIEFINRYQDIFTLNGTQVKQMVDDLIKYDYMSLPEAQTYYKTIMPLLYTETKPEPQSESWITSMFSFWNGTTPAESNKPATRPAFLAS